MSARNHVWGARACFKHAKVFARLRPAAILQAKIEEYKRGPARRSLNRAVPSTFPAESDSGFIRFGTIEEDRCLVLHGKSYCRAITLDLVSHPSSSQRSTL
jgi:hypothetical protein